MKTLTNEDADKSGSIPELIMRRCAIMKNTLRFFPIVASGCGGLG